MANQSPQQPSKNLRELTANFLKDIWGILDEIGKGLMGDLWSTFYESVRDAIALGLLLQIPNVIGTWILGKDYSDFEACLQESILGVNRYACMVIIFSDFLLWVVLGGRTLARFAWDVQKLIASLKDKKNGSK